MLVLKKKDSSGFSLIELLIVLTIIASIFAVGYASFRDYSRRQDTEAVARQVRGHLSLAKERAFSGVKPTTGTECTGTNTLMGHGIFAVAGGLQYRLYAICTGGTSYIDTINMPTGYTIVRTYSSGPVVSTYFKVLGQGTSLGAGNDAIFTITNTATNQSTQVRMTSSGEIK